MADVLRTIKVDPDLYFSLLERMIGLTEKLQNFGASDTTHPAPQEGLVADIVMETLKPHMVRLFEEASTR
jgi:hypothetical protein